VLRGRLVDRRALLDFLVLLLRVVRRELAMPGPLPSPLGMPAAFLARTAVSCARPGAN
jgi:hypothetical protein